MKNLLAVILVFIVASCDDELAISKDLRGEWRWKSSCGGFAGCTYASGTDSRKLTVDGTSLSIRINGELDFQTDYSILMQSDTAHVRTYLLDLNGNGTWTVKISDNLMMVILPGLNFTSSYKRIK